MLKYTKTQNLNGSSVVTEDGSEQIVVTMNGSVNSDGTTSFNYYKTNKDLYNKHKSEVQTDILEFQDILESLE